MRLLLRSLAVLIACLVAPAALAQSSARKASDGRPIQSADRAVLAPGHPAAARTGGLTFYATRAEFDAAHPGLPIEDFEDVNITLLSCWSFSPVDSNTNDECYDPGTLMAPLVMAARGPTQHVEDAVIALSAGYFGQPSVVAGANLEVDTTEVRFEPAVGAVGMDVFAFFGNPGITVNVYDADANLLGSTTIPGDTLGTFFGVRAEDAAIGAIRADADEDYTMLDDIAADPSTVGTEPLPSAPFRFAVDPNPFEGAAVVRLTLAQPAPVRVAVFDALGREVAHLHDGPLAAGIAHQIAFDGAALAPGVYVVRVVGPRISAAQTVTRF